MQTLKRILFPVSFSERCLGAARYVDAYARKFEAKVTMVHVVDFADYIFGMPEFHGYGTHDIHAGRMAKAKKDIEAFLPEIAAAGRVLLEGDPARQIVEYSNQHDSDLIMMPSHGFGPFRRFIIGSVTAKVLHDAHCAVWTGTHMEIAPPRPVIGFERIVCAMDLSENRGLPLRWAAMFAASCGAKVTIAHAVPAVETIPEKYLNTDLFLDLCRQAAGIIEKTKEELGVDWPVEVRGGDPEKVVHEVAEEKEADLVIVGRGHAHGLGRLRTHAYAIIRHSPCPVISV